MKPTLPPHAQQEFDTLNRYTPNNPYLAWSHGPWDTAFREESLPYSDRDDPRFRIIVPVSGGLDSATCYQMARMAGLPVEAVMVDTGVPYAARDLMAARTIAGDALTIVDLPQIQGWRTYDEVQVGRNSIIVWRLLEWARSFNWWGEIWFGNLGGNYLETPIVGGDKSYRWATTLQHLMTVHGHDFRLSSPLGGMSKSDLVSWWAARNQLPLALATRSCFADTAEQCGRCWACLYRYVAFAARGYAIEVMYTYPHGIDFADAAAEFWRRSRWDIVTTHPARMVEVRTVLESLGLGEESVSAGH
jgi:7-cyano-7-deazaguanine synthase in queuosine biosynthesis